MTWVTVAITVGSNAAIATGGKTASPALVGRRRYDKCPRRRLFSRLIRLGLDPQTERQPAEPRQFGAASHAPGRRPGDLDPEVQFLANSDDPRRCLGGQCQIRPTPPRKFRRSAGKR